MNYTAAYVDEKGASREITITEEDSRAALKNDRAEVERRYNPRYVTVKRVQPKSGEAVRFELTVDAETHYLESASDTEPKECASMTATVVCYPGYPLTPIKAFYPKDHYLASKAVFSSGSACIDRWVILESSLITVMDKLVRDMIHDPNVVQVHDGLANSRIADWYDENVKAGLFPTMPQKKLFAPEIPALPPRRASGKVSAPPPPLPGRRGQERRRRA